MGNSCSRGPAVDNSRAHGHPSTPVALGHHASGEYMPPGTCPAMPRPQDVDGAAQDWEYIPSSDLDLARSTANPAPAGLLRDAQASEAAVAVQTRQPQPPAATTDARQWAADVDGRTSAARPFTSAYYNSAPPGTRREPLGTGTAPPRVGGLCRCAFHDRAAGQTACNAWSTTATALPHLLLPVSTAFP